MARLEIGGNKHGMSGLPKGWPAPPGVKYLHKNEYSKAALQVV